MTRCPSEGDQRHECVGKGAGRMKDSLTSMASDALDMLDYAMRYGDAMKVYEVVKQRGYAIPTLEADGISAEALIAEAGMVSESVPTSHHRHEWGYVEAVTEKVKREVYHASPIGGLCIRCHKLRTKPKRTRSGPR